MHCRLKTCWGLSKERKGFWEKYNIIKGRRTRGVVGVRLCRKTELKQTLINEKYLNVWKQNRWMMRCKGEFTSDIFLKLIAFSRKSTLIIIIIIHLISKCFFRCSNTLYSGDKTRWNRITNIKTATQHHSQIKSQSEEVCFGQCFESGCSLWCVVEGSSRHYILIWPYLLQTVE